MYVSLYLKCIFASFSCDNLVYFFLNFRLFRFRFVSSVLPPGSQDLSGNEVDTIINFKNALGIDDPEAAAMHMEVFLSHYLSLGWLYLY